MIKSLLIANRGEIACRIIRTARRLGVRTVAVYSDADAGAQHVLQADAAVALGPAPARDSYLNIAAVVAAARASGAQAVHPGYGFLSENADFAEACVAAGLIFVGPTAAAIRAMGSKIEAKRLVAGAGTRVVPGYQDDDQSDARLLAAATDIGYPVLIKASAGGGGKGMRRVDDPDQFLAALAGARREAAAAFGDDRVLLERCLRAPKHLEVQVLADQSGHTVHLFERDCSVQRRHQKVVEEAPAPTVSPSLRMLLGEAAVQAAKAIGYLGAGTVEFIAEGDTFYFMEMNTRLQVEHPVTEAVTGLDLVEWQLRIAAGERLALAQEDLSLRGHAIEARLYAENPERRFLPSTGVLERLVLPGSVRVDTGVVQGDVVTMHYDPMLAKLIAHAPDRAQAIAQLDQALASLRLAGVSHNGAYLRAVLAHDEFRGGYYSTRFAEDFAADLLATPDDVAPIAAALMLRHRARGVGPWHRADGFQLNREGGFGVRLKRDGAELDVDVGASGTSAEAVTVRLGGRRYLVSHETIRGDELGFRLHRDGSAATGPGWIEAEVLCRPDAVHVMCQGRTVRLTPLLPDVGAFAHTAVSGERIVAPMPGQVIAVAVATGDTVAAGARLMIIEAMKMEHVVAAPRAGKVASVAYAVGDRVEDGAELVVLQE